MSKRKITNKTSKGSKTMIFVKVVFIRSFIEESIYTI